MKKPVAIDEKTYTALLAQAKKSGLDSVDALLKTIANSFSTGRIYAKSVEKKIRGKVSRKRAA